MPSLGDLMVRVGAEIDPSFNSTMDGASGKLSDFSDQAGTVGDAWGHAAGKITDAIPGITNLGDESETASKKIGDMVEGLLALGEALAISEGLKEFAGDALTLYSNVEKATTALTALTGSAGTADQMVEGLKNLALNDALSFPQLLQAAQGMTAMGFSTGQVNTILQTAGDTAAATGGNIDGIANAIGRMVASGNIGARQLLTLKINTGDLGEAMDVTSGKVTAAFSALDQTGRIDALNDALSKFSGGAAAAAQTVAGQWQILKTQWEGIMESIGAALAPVAKQIISFVSIEVIPFFQSMIDGFQQLSPNMQTLVTVATAAVPVVAAVALGLAAMGTAFAALSGVGEVVGVLAAVGVAVAGIHLSGLDTAALNLYHAIADNFPNVPELFTNIGTAVDAVSGKFNDWLQKSTGQAPLLAANLGGVQDTLDRIVPSISKMSLGDWISAALNPSTMLKVIMGELADTIQYLGGNYSSMAGAVVTALGNVNAANDLFNHNMAAQAGAFTSSGIQLSAIAKAYQTLKDNLTDAQEKLGEVKTAYDNGQASLGQYAAAQNAVETAQLALNPNFETQKQALIDLNKATTDLNASQTGLNELLKLIAPPVITLTGAQNNLAAANKGVQDAAAAYATAQQNLNAAIALGPGHANELAAAQDALKTAETAGKDAKTAYEKATKDVSTAQKDATQFAKDQATTDSDYATMLNALGKPALNTYADAVGALSKAQSDYYNAVMNRVTIQAQLNELAAAGKKGTTDYADAEGALATTQGVVTQAQKNYSAAQTQVNGLYTDLEKGSKALASAEQALADLYQKNLNPDLTDLVGALQNVRDAKTQVTNAAIALNAAEDEYQDTLIDFFMGGASIGNVVQATNNLDGAKKTLTNDEKLLSDAVSQLTGTFGVSQTAIKNLTDDQGKMSTSTQNAQAAFSSLKIQSSSDLDDLAAKAHSAFTIIQQSGTGSSSDIRQAWINDLTAEKAALVSHGQDLTTVQQTTLTNLLNQQSDFNNSMKNYWHDFYTTTEGDVSQLSDKLLTDLFTGSNSFGKDALNELEKIAAAFTSTLIQPVTTEIGKFIAGALTNLGTAFSGISQLANSTSSTVQLAFFGQGASSASSATSGIMGALSTATTALSGIVNMVSGIASAVAGIVGDIETAHTNTILTRMEQETARMAIYLGDSGNNSIQGLMWRLTQDLEFGEMEKDLNIIAPDIDKLGAPFWAEGFKDLDAIVLTLSNLTQTNSGDSLSVTAGGDGSGGNTNIGTSGGTEEYLPGTPGTTSTETVPLATTDIVQALNNYQTTLQKYIDGTATKAQLEAAQAQVDQLKIYADDQQKYTALLQSYLADPTAAGKISLDAAKAALTAAGMTTETVTTPAGPPQLVTTVGELVTANTALSNINTTLQFSVGLNPWFQGAFQNINDGIVACAGWLQGIAGILGYTNSEITSLTAAIAAGTAPALGTGSDTGTASGTSGTAGSGSSTPSGTATAAPAPVDTGLADDTGKYVDLQNWTRALQSQAEAMSFLKVNIPEVASMTAATLPVLPEPEQIASSLPATPTTGTGSTDQAMSAHAVQGAAPLTTTSSTSDLISFLTAQFGTFGALLSGQFSKLDDTISKAAAQLDAGISTGGALLGSLGTDLMSFSDRQSNQMAELIAAVKTPISIPSFGVPALATSGASASAIAQMSGSNSSVTITFNDSKITSENDARNALDRAINELRRRNRIM